MAARRKGDPVASNNALVDVKKRPVEPTALEWPLPDQ
jgi:hypothetical protein